MAKKLNFGNVILCEHAVAGANNKHTLVNVYPADILVNALPAQLTFGLYAEYRSARNEDLTIELSLGGRVIARVSVTVNGRSLGEVGVILLPLLMGTLETEGRFVVTASAPGYAKSKIVDRIISVAPAT